MPLQKEYDIVIVGAGVLGSAIAYELSLTFSGNIAVIEKENGAGLHTSTRNTGVIHRPFRIGVNAFQITLPRCNLKRAILFPWKVMLQS